MWVLTSLSVRINMHMHARTQTMHLATEDSMNVHQLYRGTGEPLYKGYCIDETSLMRTLYAVPTT